MASATVVKYESRLGGGDTMTIENFDHLHSCYCRATTREIPYSVAFHYRWALWASKGWSQDDLLIVIAFIKRRIKEKRRQPESLRLYNLLDPDRFLEDVTDARQESRKPVPTARQAALKSIGRAEPEPDRVQTPEQVMRGSAALQELLRLRDSL